MLDELGNVFEMIEKQIADGIIRAVDGQGNAPGDNADSPYAFSRDDKGSLTVRGFTRGAAAAELVIPEGVVIVEKNAFKGCQSIKSVVLPASLQVVEKSAFKDCKQLRSVTFLSSAASVQEGAFEGCSTLEKLALPRETLVTEPSAFFGCAVKEICLPPQTYLGGAAFASCISLEKVSFLPPDEEGYALRFGEFAFSYTGLEEIEIPSGDVEFKDNIFFQCAKLKKAVLPYGISELPARTFMCCYELEDVQIPNTVEKICSGAFVRCDSLMSVYIPDSVKYIESESFFDCRALASVRLPACVTLAEERNDSGDMTQAFEMIAEKGTFTVETPGSGISGEFGFSGRIGMDDMMKAVLGAALEGDSNSLSVIASAPEKFIRDLLTGSPETGDIDRLLELISADKSRFYVPHEKLKIIDLPESGERYLAGFLDGCTSDLLDIPKGVTHIAGCAFKENNDIRSIRFAPTLRYIGASAFEGCWRLQRIDLPDTLKTICTGAFADCRSLKQVLLNTGKCTLGTGVFRICRALERITLPADMTAVPPEMFYKCDSLEEVIIQNGVTSIGFSAFCQTAITSLRLPDSIRHIGKSAFRGCWRLKKVYIPGSVTEIENRAFEQCNELESFSIVLNRELDLLHYYRDISGYDTPLLKRVRISGRDFEVNGRLDTYVFRGALDTLAREGNSEAKAALERLSEEYSAISRIGGHEMFKLRTDRDINNNELIVVDGLTDGVSAEDIHIPEGVTDIGRGAFFRCADSKRLYIPDSVKRISDDSLEGSGFEEIYLPKGMKFIPSGLFSNCRKLRKAVMPEGLEIIEAWAFFGCSSLAAAVIPDTVRVIGIGAFSGCGKLRSIKLPLCRLIDNEGTWKKPFDHCGSLELALIDGKEYPIDKSFDMSEMSRIAADLLHKGSENARRFLEHSGEHVLASFIKNGDTARAELILSEFGGFTEEQINKSLENAMRGEQHEIYLALLAYKREKLGFDDGAERFNL